MSRNVFLINRYIIVMFVLFQMFPAVIYLFVENYTHDEIVEKNEKCINYYMDRHEKIYSNRPGDVDSDRRSLDFNMYRKHIVNMCEDVVGSTTGRYIYTNLFVLFSVIIFSSFMLRRMVLKSIESNSVAFGLVCIFIVIFVNLFGMSAVWNFGVRNSSPPWPLKIEGFEILKKDQLIFDGGVVDDPEVSTGDRFR